MEKKYQPAKQSGNEYGLTSFTTPKNVNQSRFTGEQQPSDIRDRINHEEAPMHQSAPSIQPGPGRLLRLPGIEALTGLKKSTIYTHMANKTDPFPTPVRIGARAVAWRESDVLAWIAARTEARPQGGNQ